jgi:hypothetical protein
MGRVLLERFMFFVFGMMYVGLWLGVVLAALYGPQPIAVICGFALLFSTVGVITGLCVTIAVVVSGK